MKIALFASGNGTNVESIIRSVETGQLTAEISGIYCDVATAKVIERGKKHGYPVYVFLPSDYQSRRAFEEAIVDQLQQDQVELVVLAGYMRIIRYALLDHYANKIVNIHPALLPQFPGKQGIKDAYVAGVTETGVTVHWVDHGVDTGPIIAQEPLKVDPNWELAELEAEIHAIEHRLYPAVLQSIIEGSH